MNKPLKFASLADLLADYVSAYACWWHTVLRVRIGLPVPHNAMYEGMVRNVLAVLLGTHAAQSTLNASHCHDICLISSENSTNQTI